MRGVGCHSGPGRLAGVGPRGLGGELGCEVLLLGRGGLELLAGLLLLGLELGEGVGTCVELGLERVLALLSGLGVCLLLFHGGDLRVACRQGVLQALLTSAVWVASWAVRSCCWAVAAWSCWRVCSCSAWSWEKASVRS